MDRDYFMSAEEALAYGMIDEIMTPRRGLNAMSEIAAAS
ncbi:MAG: ATP-dependent Clp protease proteolytic subunit [Acidimicrobiales bacterium]